ncbi:MAG: 16S rRNA (cytosine(967)-C(5))-methyltransferase RsmB [Clostridiales bacterium]|nr:16S rRNA (cytosine(967)-C(5))-methyltransferase RsmB [Clostridiales bacterium]
MDANRKTAYHTLLDMETKKAYSNLALNHHILINKPDDPAFVRELVYGVLENKMLLDHYLDQLIEKGIKSVRHQDLTILRMGLYQLAYMDSVPDYAAVNESVSLAKRYARGRGGFINGVLRGYLKKKDSLTLPDRDEDLVAYLSVKYSYAPWIVRLWLDEYDDPSFVESLLSSGDEAPPFTIRLNWLKIMKKDLIQVLEERGYTVTEGRYSANALHIKGSGLLESDLYANGLFSVQDEASQMVAEVLDPQQGNTVVDVCAAPGGKTMAIAERMNNRGRIVAQDIYKRKIALIEHEAARLGVRIVETRTWDSTRVDSSLVGKADRVLVDAPCSGLGVVRRKPEIKYKSYNEEMAMLPQKQQAILEAASKYVNAGGVLVYSTCTINPRENEEVVSSFLRSHPNFMVEETKQLLPHVNGTDGFFICKMRKSDSITNQ